MLVILYSTCRCFFADAFDKRYYIMDSAFDEKAQADITGIVQNYEKKEKSYAVYLGDVSVKIKSPGTVYHLPALLVYLSIDDTGAPGFKAGCCLSFSGDICKFQTPSNPGQFNQREYYREKNIYYMAFAQSADVNDGVSNSFYYVLLNTICSVKEKLADVYKKTLPEKECGIVTAMLLGEKTAADMDIRTLYQENGIGHLLAVSGLHISVIGMSVYRLTRIFIIFIWSIIKYIYKVIYNSLKNGSIDFTGKTPATLFYVTMADIMCSIANCLPVFTATVFIILYGIMTGFSISAQRAVIMMVVMLWARVTGKSYDMLSAMGISAVLVLLQKPYALYSCSFLLSYGAVAGIAVIYPVLYKIYTGAPDDINGYNIRRKYINRAGKFYKSTEDKSKIYKNPLAYLKYLFYILAEKTAGLFLSSLSIQFTTLPFILYFYYEFPLYGVFLNIIVIPSASVIVTICAAAGLVGLFCLPFSGFLSGTAYIILNIYEALCKAALQLPFHIVITGKPAKWQMALYFLLLFLLTAIVAYSGKKDNGEKNYMGKYTRWFLRHTDIILLSVLSVMFFVIIFVNKYSKRYNGVEIVFLDTGQGDAIFIRDNKGVTYLIDGGSSSVSETGKYRIIPFLKCKGIDKVDYMIMTHHDEDHISGLKEILAQSCDGIKVSQLLLPDPAENCKDEAYFQMVKLAGDNNVNTRVIEAGDTFVSSDERKDTSPFIMKCLHPVPGFEAESANAYSTVLSITYGSASFLLTGDLEANGESALLDRLCTDNTLPSKYNVLKVAHHGSKNSSSKEFLDRISPDVSVISCGKNNSYGHPHKELVKRLGEAGSRWIATKDAGAVTVLSDGSKTDVSGYNYNGN